MQIIAFVFLDIVTILKLNDYTTFPNVWNGHWKLQTYQIYRYKRDTVNECALNTSCVFASLFFTFTLNSRYYLESGVTEAYARCVVLSLYTIILLAFVVLLTVFNWLAASTIQLFVWIEFRNDTHQIDKKCCFVLILIFGELSKKKDKKKEKKEDKKKRA